VVDENGNIIFSRIDYEERFDAFYDPIFVPALSSAMAPGPAPLNRLVTIPDFPDSRWLPQVRQVHATPSYGMILFFSC
jgi:hypothetical protein